MSVACEAQSHDHGPDNRPNLGMLVEQVFLLKDGFLADKQVLGSRGPIGS